MTTALAIPAFDYVEQFFTLREEVLAAVEDVLVSGSLVLGPRVRQFEVAFAEFLNAPGEAVGVGNGTDALALALRALAIGPGDEVLTVANTAIPTATAISMSGARPVFCEIDPHTLLLDLDDLEARITPRTKAIVPVHLYGNAVDMPAVLEIAKRYQLRVVEDCAQSCGTTLHGRQTGTFGDVGCFSFYPTKNLGAYGDAGLCFTRDEHLANRIRDLRSYGRGTGRGCTIPGANSRLDELQAAILSVKLRHLHDFIARRRAVAAAYHRYLSPSIARPRVDAAVGHSYHLFVIGPADRAAVIERLEAEAIGYGIHYPLPLHRMAGFPAPGDAAPSLPVAEEMAARVISLPCYPELPDEAVRTICAVVNEAVRDEQ